MMASGHRSSRHRNDSDRGDGDAAARTITSAEVRGWFGDSKKARLTEAQYTEIAVCLTKWRWPSDPPRVGEPSQIDTNVDRGLWWDFRVPSLSKDLCYSRRQMPLQTKQLS
jgi:hypothetical protein